MSKVHPWQSGPTELLEQALWHLEKGTDLDRRIAFLLLDVGVETLFKTFLTLPIEVTNAATSYNDRRKATEGGFHDLIAGLKAAASSRLVGYDLSHIEFYHTLRNTLYHQGNGITVPDEHVVGYAKDATYLLKVLLDVDLTDSIVLNPEVTEQVTEQLTQQVRDVEVALTQFVEDVKLVMEKLEPKLLFPSTILALRGLAVGLDIQNAQDRVNTYIKSIEASVGDTRIRRWLLDLVEQDLSMASLEALNNTRFVFELLKDPISFYLLIIGAFVLPEGEEERGFMYAAQDFTYIIMAPDQHIVGLFDAARRFHEWGGLKFVKASSTSWWIARGKEISQRLGTLSTFLQSWINNN